MLQIGSILLGIFVTAVAFILMQTPAVMADSPDEICRGICEGRTNDIPTARERLSAMQQCMGICRKNVERNMRKGGGKDKDD
jgi:hypothetical protein